MPSINWERQNPWSTGAGWQPLDKFSGQEGAALANAFTQGQQVYNQNQQAQAGNILKQRVLEQNAPFVQARTAENEAQARERATKALVGPVQGLLALGNEAEKRDPANAELIVQPYLENIASQFESLGYGNVPRTWRDIKPFAEGFVKGLASPKTQNELLSGEHVIDNQKTGARERWLLDKSGNPVRKLGLKVEKEPKETKSEVAKVFREIGKDLEKFSLDSSPEVVAAVKRHISENEASGKTYDENVAETSEFIANEVGRVEAINKQKKAEAEKSGYFGTSWGAKPVVKEKPWYQQPVNQVIPGGTPGLNTGGMPAQNTGRPSNIPSEFTERVVNPAGRVGWKNSETDKIYAE